VKGLETIIRECDRLLAELRHREDPEAQQERLRLRLLREKAATQLRDALRDMGLPVNGNGDRGAQQNA
jgi:hypothetical protein